MTQQVKTSITPQILEFKIRLLKSINMHRIIPSCLGFYNFPIQIRKGCVSENRIKVSTKFLKQILIT